MEDLAVKFWKRSASALQRELRTSKDVTHGSFLLSAIGIDTLGCCLSSISNGIEESPKVFMKRIYDAGASCLRREADELLYGKSGYLYCLLLLLSGSHVHQEDRAKMEDMVLLCCARILQKGDQLMTDLRATYPCQLGTSNQQALMPKLIWMWHGKIYLGAAHGLTGILSLLLASERILNRRIYSDDDLNSMLITVEWLLHLCLDESNNVAYNLPYSIAPQELALPRGRQWVHDHKGKRELIQMCHGCPGIIMLFMEVLRWQSLNMHGTAGFCLRGSLEASKIYQYVQDWLMKFVWPKGLLTKGLGLCHGIGGNAFLFLSYEQLLRNDMPFHHSSNDRQQQINEMRHAVECFARVGMQWKELTTAHLLRVPDHPHSLMEGLAGFIIFLATLQHPELTDKITAFPAFLDI